MWCVVTVVKPVAHANDVQTQIVVQVSKMLKKFFDFQQIRENDLASYDISQFGYISSVNSIHFAASTINVIEDKTLGCEGINVVDVTDVKGGLSAYAIARLGRLTGPGIK